ncbi:DUF262 domain-containing protein [Tumebacillus flagellatus]|uniref:GmrSD restriction endonucleases N-terminal domain-containing protein n=1 Tax=Tumebacillus flagellatus TaxID=1157490 RepID=A0A074LRW1_9BACL|nr:DUF262 domain-containing protein [Tumebacillus flagellatus]KEO83859.1 hypothetical protein EL26_08050 [Tumebacillus flagellatus]
MFFFFFPEDSVRYTNQQISIYHVIERIRANEINLYPQFHRMLVWNQNQQSKLIESLLMGIPLPLFYVNEERWGEWDVLDGVQRLMTILRFVNGELVLSDANYLSELRNIRFQDLPDRLQHRFMHTTLNFVVIDSRTSDELKMEMFRRINTGGTLLTEFEVIYSNLSSEARNFLYDLSTDDLFMFMTPNLSEKHFRREELVYYFLVLISRYNNETKELDLSNNMNAELRMFAGYINDALSFNQNSWRELFTNALTNSKTYLGAYAFDDPITKRFRKSLFLIISVVMSNLDVRYLKQIGFKESYLRKLSTDRQFADIMLKWSPRRSQISKQILLFTNFLKEMM